MKTVIKNQMSTSNLKNVVLKKLKPFALSTKIVCYIILVMVSLSSCSKDDAPIQVKEEILPTLTLESGSEDIFKGVIGSPTSGTLNYTVKAETPEIFKQLVVNKIVNNVETHFETINSDSPNFVPNSTSFTYNLNHELTAGNLNSTISFKAIVTDGAGNTTSLDFAPATVKEPLLSETLELRIGIPVTPSVKKPIFMYAKDNVITEKTIGNIVEDNNNMEKNIFAVLSFNDGSGLYLSAPNTTLEVPLVDKFNVLTTTKFKEQDLGWEEFNALNIYDSYKMKELFDAALFNSNEEKAEGLVSGKVFSFLTEDQRDGLLHIMNVENVNGELYVDVEVYLEKK